MNEKNVDGRLPKIAATALKNLLPLLLAAHKYTSIRVTLSLWTKVKKSISSEETIFERMNNKLLH